MVLTNVRDTTHADSLTLFELNIAILLADVTKPEKFDFDLTCDVTRDPEVNKICFQRFGSRVSSSVFYQNI